MIIDTISEKTESKEEVQSLCHKIEQFKNALFEHCESYGGAQYAQNIINAVSDLKSDDHLSFTEIVDAPREQSHKNKPSPPMKNNQALAATLRRMKTIHQELLTRIREEKDPDLISRLTGKTQRLLADLNYTYRNAHRKAHPDAQ